MSNNTLFTNLSDYIVEVSQITENNVFNYYKEH